MKELDEKTQREIAERQATMMLMEQWVRENVSEVAYTFADLVPFICGECNRANLQQRMNTVNQTFASVALNVIKQRNEAQADGRVPMCLPADATEMDNALYDLSRFLKKFNGLGCLLERNSDLPAFRMAISQFDEADSI